MAGRWDGVHAFPCVVVALQGVAIWEPVTETRVTAATAVANYSSLQHVDCFYQIKLH